MTHGRHKLHRTVELPAREVESGHVLYFPELKFRFEKHEEIVSWTPKWSNGSAKNISLDKDEGSIKGAAGTSEELKELERAAARYRSIASNWSGRYFRSIPADFVRPNKLSTGASGGQTRFLAEG